MNFLGPFTHDYQITQLFGDNAKWYKSQIGINGGHNGIDYGAPGDTDFDIIGDGRIVWAEIDPYGPKFQGGFGLMLRVEHGDGYESLYGHTSSLAVVVGQDVKTGQVGGKVGHSGFVYPPGPAGAHLHLGLYLNGKAIDPLPLLNVPTNLDQQQSASKHIDVASLKIYRVLEDGLRVRIKPNTASKIVCALYAGMVVGGYATREVEGIKWLQCSDDGSYWCATSNAGIAYLQEIS